MLRKLPLLLATIGAVIAAPASAPAETPKRGGILNFAITAETSNYDCHGSQTFGLLHPITPFYSLLVKFDATENSQIIGDLAKSWTISPDGITYTFKLHEGVKFHDGSPLTSADIKATFERIANPPAGRDLRAQGALRRRRLDRDAGRGDRRLQAQGRRTPRS